MEFISVIFLSVIVEGVVSYIKMFFVDGRVQWQVIITLFFGVFVSIAYKVDLLKIVGLSSEIPFLGQALTGILVSRGSNYMFDLLRHINELINKINTNKIA